MAFATKAALKAEALAYSLIDYADYDKMIQRAEEYLNRKLVTLRERETAGEPFVLTNDTDSNWLLENASDIYLNAVLMQIRLWVRDYQDASVLSQLIDGMIDDTVWESAREDSQDTLTIDPALLTQPPFNIGTGESDGGDEIVLD